MKYSKELPNYTKGEEIFNMVSHIVGASIGIAVLTLCIIFAAINGNGYGIASGIVYGISLILLYTMSSIYHGLKADSKAKKVFQIIDHCSIFLLIAGTYTPFALCTLREYNTSLGWCIFGIVWGCAVIAGTLTAIDLKKFEKFSLVCYVVMGWIIVFFIKQTYESIGAGGIVFLVTGGVAYTLGSVLYVVGKKKKWIQRRLPRRWNKGRRSLTAPYPCRRKARFSPLFV